MSNNKMYVRVGRKFKYVPNMVGMYWDGLHLLSKERRDDSVAMVIAQHYDHVTMCALAPSHKVMNWKDAKEACKSYFGENCISSISDIICHFGRLPNRAELLLLKNHPDLLKSIHELTPSIYFWTNEEYSSNNAWYLYLSLDYLFGFCSSSAKGNDLSVLAFVDVPITDLI